MQQTSLDAFSSVRPSLGDRQQMVYDLIRCFGPLTNKEVSSLSGLPINSVTPRTLELRKLGLVVESEELTDVATGRRAIAWRCRL